MNKSQARGTHHQGESLTQLDQGVWPWEAALGRRFSGGREASARGRLLKGCWVVQADGVGVRLREKGGRQPAHHVKQRTKHMGNGRGQRLSHIVLHFGFKPGTRRVKEAVSPGTLVLPPPLAILYPVNQLRQEQPKLRECNVPSIVLMVG